MITGSAITGVEWSSGLQVTTTSGIAEISSVRICGPSTRASQPRGASAACSAKAAFRLMIEWFIEAGAIIRGSPRMNSQRSGWRACHASNSSTVRGQSSGRCRFRHGSLRIGSVPAQPKWPPRPPGGDLALAGAGLVIRQPRTPPQIASNFWPLTASA